MAKTNERVELEKQLEALLTQAQAHITFEDAVKGIGFNYLGRQAPGIPYTLWQLVEHLRIAQYDILDFCRNSQYRGMSWPDDYWPKEKMPDNVQAWKNSLVQVREDRDVFINLLKDAKDIWMPFPYGTGQNLVREALLIADHNSYHTGQIILLRRALGIYP